MEDVAKGDNDVLGFRARFFETILLGILLVAGAILRFTSLDWDGLQHVHPDERHINWVQTTIEWRGGVHEWLHHEDSSLNPFYWPETKNTVGIEVPLGEPRRFAYGHFPLYLSVLLAKGLSQVGNLISPLGLPPGIGEVLNVYARTEYEHLTLVGRVVAASADTITIMLVYLLGRQIGGIKVALLSASFTTLSVQHIQQAHFGTFDSILTMCISASLLSLVHYVKTGNRQNIIVSGSLIGLAVGAKFSAIMLVIPAATGVVWSCAGKYPGREYTRGLVDHGFLLVCSGLLVFSFTNPFAIIEWREFFESIARQSAMVRGLTDWPFVVQYRGTLPYIYQLGQQGRWLLGWPLTIVAYGGMSWCLWEWMQRLRARIYGVKTGQYAVLFGWLIPYLVVTGAFLVKFPRYMLPALPVLFVFAGVVLCDMVQRWPKLGTALAALALVPTGVYALAFAQVYSVNHPWVTASESVYSVVPENARILLEKWDHPLPLDQVTDGRRLSRKIYNQQVFDPVARPDDEGKLTQILDKVAKSDFIIVASNRNYGPVGMLADIYPLTNAYYRALFDGNLGYELVHSATRFPKLGSVGLRSDPFLQAGMSWPRGLEPISDEDLMPGYADESFTVYDHPLVLVYRNQARLGVTELRRRLGSYYWPSND